jgi:tRNA (Thr-GGU) A37 N-methylase
MPMPKDDTARASESSEILLRPIGYIHTPFHTATGTPIQSSVANGAEGTIELFPEFVQGLQLVTRRWTR